jgi:hypothetical protein
MRFHARTLRTASKDERVASFASISFAILTAPEKPPHLPPPNRLRSPHNKHYDKRAAAAYHHLEEALERAVVHL